MTIIKWIVNLTCIILFRKTYLDGFCEEPTKKDTYQITTLFPNEEVMQQVDYYINRNDISA